MIIYHCRTPKTASQWFKAFFSDKMFLYYTGYRCISYVDIRSGKVKLPKRNIRVIITDLNVDYETFIGMEKPAEEKYKYFFILRDPRDVVISWYYSVKYSHNLSGEIESWRKVLHELTKEQGLKWTIDHLIEEKYFETQLSWFNNAPKECLFKYEGFVANNHGFISVLLYYLGLFYFFPEEVLYNLITDYSFKAMSGRDPGEEDKHSYYRKGIVGDWKDHFTISTYNYFKERTEEVHIRLGYISSHLLRR